MWLLPIDKSTPFSIDIKAKHHDLSFVSFFQQFGWQTIRRGTYSEY
jgi:hypothetical protein